MILLFKLIRRIKSTGFLNTISLIIISVQIRLQHKRHKKLESQWAYEDAKKIKDRERVLFLDLGSNLGQAYKWFKTFFDPEKIQFELFEPNPNCYAELLELPDAKKKKITIKNVGVGSQDGVFKFYGLSENEGGKFSQGGSIVKEHCSRFYKASEKDAIDVKIIDFSCHLKKKSETFDKIIVKMDIEGAEFDLLQSLIDKDTIHLIDILYVEFHSHHLAPPKNKIMKKKERGIVSHINENTDVKLRIWH